MFHWFDNNPSTLDHGCMVPWTIPSLISLRIFEKHRFQFEFLAYFQFQVVNRLVLTDFNMTFKAFVSYWNFDFIVKNSFIYICRSSISESVEPWVSYESRFVVGSRYKYLGKLSISQALHSQEMGSVDFVPDDTRSLGLSAVQRLAQDLRG